MTRLPPLRRWAINILCGLSLLIFLLAMTLWVRSYFVADVIAEARVRFGPQEQDRPTEWVYHDIAWSRGAIAITRKRDHREGYLREDSGWFYARMSYPRPLGEAASAGDRVNIQLGGLQLLHAVDSYEDGWTSRQLAMAPLWMFVLFAIPPLLWVPARVRWRGQRGRGFPVYAEPSRAVDVNAARAAEGAAANAGAAAAPPARGG